jgi:type VI secretion system secreted protein VgrG
MASFVSSLLDTQQNRLIKIYTPADSPLKTPLGGDLLLLRSFSGHEGVSRLFQFELTMHSTDHKIDLKSMIGQSATLVVTLPDESERYINGVFSSFSQSGSSALEQGLVPTTYTEYRATLVPWLWMLTKESDCRIFQNKTVQDIIDAIFSKPEYADIMDVDYRLSGNFEPREYCVQYRETDFNFVSRLMEEEGIFYFFEHTDTSHTLVLANQPTDFKPLAYHPTISFREERAPDTISEWSVGQEVRPGAYTLRDFNFQQPTLDLTAPEFGIDPRAYEIYDYPGEYITKGRGAAIAQTRMEEEEMPTVIASGASICRGLVAGYRFRLKDHHRDDFNQEYMITAVFHHSDQGDNYRTQPDSSQKNFSYVNRFQCIPYPTPFRPPRVTPEPVMRGSQTAIVVGKEGEEIWPDKYGRVKVWFHWDREKERDGKAILPEERSCWIRISEGWAGKGWGAMHLPRIGQEVIVDFLEGDPDQPIITGRVYNGDNMPFYQLPDYKTLSYYKSNSSLGGNGFNEIRFEDKKGKEQVFMHSQKRMDVRVKGSYYDTCHGNRETVVGWENKDDSGGDYNLLVEGDHNLHVKKGVYADIDKKLNITVKDDVVCDFESNQSTLVKIKCELNAQQIIMEASQTISLKVGGNFIMIDPSGVTIYGTMVKINSGGFGTETGDPDIADAEDAYTSDNGQPGYLDKLAKQGTKSRSKKHRKLRSQHYIAPPRPGEDARMTAIRNKLQYSATGRHALEVYDRFGITPTFNPGGTAYGSGAVNMDPSRTDPATSFVHEMNHAQHDKEGTSADINDPNRAHYIDQQLKEDAEGERLAYQTQKELADAGHPETYNSVTSPSFQQGYQNGVAAEKARNPNATPEQLDKAGNDAGQQRLLNDYRNGNVNTGNTTPPQSYVQYWGQAWDGAHPPPAPAGGGGH